MCGTADSSFLSTHREGEVCYYASSAPPEPAGSSMEYFVRAFSACSSSASSISRSISFGYGNPDASHSFGYMLMDVKPGIVFSSFT